MGLFRKYLKQFTTNKINIYCIEIYIIYACGQSLVKDWLCICVNMVWSWMKLDENNLWHYCTANTRTSYQMTPVSSAPNMKWYQNTQVICFEAVVWYKSVHMFMHNFVHTFIWFGRGRGYCYYSTAAGGTYCDLLQIELIAVVFFFTFWLMCIFKSAN